MNAYTAAPLDYAPKPEYDRIDGRHHECESAGAARLGTAELRKELDSISM